GARMAATGRRRASRAGNRRAPGRPGPDRPPASGAGRGRVADPVEWVETTGRTIEEAKDAALDQLGVDEQDAEFEVLEDAKLGLFGRLRTEARVRARVQPKRPRAKEERRDRRKRGEGRGDSRAGPVSPPSRYEGVSDH